MPGSRNNNIPTAKWIFQGDSAITLRDAYDNILTLPVSVIEVGDNSIPKLQALVYDILPSTTAVFSYAIGSRQLLVNEQFFCWCSNSKFVTNNSNYIRRLFYVAYASSDKTKIV